MDRTNVVTILDWTFPLVSETPVDPGETPVTVTTLPDNEAVATNTSSTRTCVPLGMRIGSPAPSHAQAPTLAVPPGASVRTAGANNSVVADTRDYCCGAGGVFGLLTAVMAD